MEEPPLRCCLAILWLTAFCSVAFGGEVAHGGELFFNFGGGSAPHSGQRNETAGVDYTFYRFVRSPRQSIEVGVSYTRLRTNRGANRSLYAVSVYPQLTFYPPKTSRMVRHWPKWALPFFFVRALGPSFISEKSLGARQQGSHFTFQAQIGCGVLLKGKTLLMVSWKHFSNAHLFAKNDGFNMPMVLHFGIRF